MYGIYVYNQTTKLHVNQLRLKRNKLFAVDNLQQFPLCGVELLCCKDLVLDIIISLYKVPLSILQVPKSNKTPPKIIKPNISD